MRFKLHESTGLNQMIVGSGLLASTFELKFSKREDVCIYAAGVSNSSCTSMSEFKREEELLKSTLSDFQHAEAFVYFGTCSVADPQLCRTPYVQHKLRMERLVSEHQRYLILRLPQVVGRTKNPHTLCNYLHSRISRGEMFELWKGAARNIIDVEDVLTISEQIIADRETRNVIINVANPHSCSVIDLVEAMEKVVGKLAVYEVVQRGTGCDVDISAATRFMKNIDFGPDYLRKVLGKYYR